MACLPSRPAPLGDGRSCRNVPTLLGRVMNKHQRVRLAAVADILEENGVEHCLIQGAKHLQLHMTLAGGRRKLPIAGSPSDWRGVMKFVHDVKVAVAEMKDGNRGHLV